MKHILFVCTGNTCRSPMAEGLFRAKVQAEGCDVEIQSVGISAMRGFPISAHADTILKEQGIDGTFTSEGISEEVVRWADLILTMTMSHKQIVIERYVEALDKTFTLKEYVEEEAQLIADMEERARLISEWHIRQALSQSSSPEETARMLELEQLAPNFDILDPFGGNIQSYRDCVQEIEQALNKLLPKLAR